MNLYDILPTVNAVLNGTAAVLLVIGYLLIRQRKIDMHRKVMITAFGVSIAFLIGYLVYHAHAKIVYFQAHRADHDGLSVDTLDAYAARGRCARAGDHHVEPRA